MRHYVLTRSAYGPAWDLEANRRRLAVTAGVTVAGMAAQTNRDWQWIVALDRTDPLRSQRRAVFESAGVPVAFIDVASQSGRSGAAFEAYRADWNGVIGERFEKVAMTRLDDDDALAPWALGKVADIATRTRLRSALILPRGLRVYNGRCTIVRHDSNAMQTLVTPIGDTMHVYAYPHREVRKVAELIKIDHRIGWVWSRHEDTISGWHRADVPISPRYRDMFPIDWSLFGEAEPGKVVRLGLRGAYFR